MAILIIRLQMGLKKTKKLLILAVSRIPNDLLSKFHLSLCIFPLHAVHHFPIRLHTPFHPASKLCQSHVSYHPNNPLHRPFHPAI